MLFGLVVVVPLFAVSVPAFAATDHSPNCGSNPAIDYRCSTGSGDGGLVNDGTGGVTGQGNGGGGNTSVVEPTDLVPTVSGGYGAGGALIRSDSGGYGYHCVPDTDEGAPSSYCVGSR